MRPASIASTSCSLGPVSISYASGPVRIPSTDVVLLEKGGGGLIGRSIGTRVFADEKREIGNICKSGSHNGRTAGVWVLMGAPQLQMWAANANISLA